MKKLILTLTILFSISINAQYAIISAVDIKEGADEGYLKLEEFLVLFTMLQLKLGYRTAKQSLK
ncbi:MAG: hypothetical protein CM15mP102_11080 [Flavobacteriales bacterium]|nr:MAG: hypothetical protein CM15mP102_11080 [Flavobacteriales bacterium]